MPIYLQGKQVPWGWTKEVEALIAKQVRGYCVHLCSGDSEIGDIRVDLYARSHSNWFEDVRDLSLPSEFADTVVCDPPYNYGRAGVEAACVFHSIRILKPGGRLLWYHFNVPYEQALELEQLWVYPNKTQPFYRFLSQHKKIQRSLSSA